MTRFRNAGAALAMAWALLAQQAVAAEPAAVDDTGKPGGEAPVGDDRDSIVVTGQRAANTASAGTKTDTPLIDTPQSISVISSATIANLGLQNLDQALRFVAGVTPEQRGASAEVYDLFTLRGFTAPVFLDGLFYVSQTDATGYAAAQADVSRLDRFEVVKGPSSALYGRSGPGGLVVEESKLPIDKDLYGSLAGTYGNFDLYRVDGDIGGRVSDDVLWRVYGSVNGAHSQQKYGKRRRRTASGAVTLGSGTPTTFTVLAAYSDDPRNSNYGVFPAVGTLFKNPNGRISQNFYGGEPDDFFARRQFGLTYIFRHEFGSDWAFRTSGRYQYVRSRLGIVYTSGLPAEAGPAPRLYGRASYSTRESNNDWVYDNQLTGKLATGPFQHELLFGADRQVLHYDEFGAFSGFGAVPPIDVYDPVYGATYTPRTPDEVQGGAPFRTITHTRQQSVYAQDQISLAGLRLTLSGRQDWARQESRTTGAAANPVKHDDKFTYRVGALYKTSLGIAPYVSYSTSFQPQSARLVDGTLADPSLGKQIEGGVKYQIPNTQILLTAAYFHIKQTNVLTFNPVSFAATQSGKVRSRGVEIEANAPLPYGFNAMVAFSRQSVKILEDSDPRRVGHGLETVGRGGVSANLDWTARGGPLAGLTVGGAVRYVDRLYAGVYADQTSPFYANGKFHNSPSYTLFDALARYDLGKLSDRLAGARLQVNAMNIFDKRHLTGCYANYGWCWYGNRRTVQGTIGFSF